MNKTMDRETRIYQKNQYIKIRNLFTDKKYKSVIKESTKYLEFFPNDIGVRFMRAKSYRHLEMFKEAIDDLKYNLTLEDNGHSLTELYFIYYYLNMYNEAIELLPQLYLKKNINSYSVSISELVMKKQLGIDIKVKKDAKCDYIRSQIFNYSTSLAFSHIKEGHLNENSDRLSKYNENIDLDYLFDLIRNNLSNGKKVNTEEMLEIYYFGISNIGNVNGATSNFIKVVVVPNTSNIITMYPVNSVDFNYISNVDVDYDKLFSKKEEKVKKISQIDKFNNRFKRV